MRNRHVLTKFKMIPKIILTIILSMSFWLPPLFAESDSASLKLLVVTGGPTLRHQIDLVPSSFYTLFEGYDNITWDHASSDEAAFQSDKLPNYDVLVMYNRSDSLSRESMQNLRSFVESGKGIVILHHALGSYNDWRWWWHDVVGGKYQMKDAGNLPKSEYKLDEHISVKTVATHPITSAVGDFHLNDETYKKLWISPAARILYETENPTSDGPIAWISAYSRSRVIVVQPGHTALAHKNADYRSLVYNAIIWSSGRSDLVKL